ncbi:putative manganese-dependent inorganic diphosphatase [Ileibacterium valens]|uniref:inorganic diphosphatase n=1 Tax=Ileibacterium valens TaxID=1862668 RepID=A0A1U7NIE6_9FIRM|nr:putative manganese-dependent inorganic diphosphatase [Ileibacterium valens]OLU36475.1 hypothetical protein BM735_12285 [Erysipelotrichaceae bacterium NYU-BL-F16]OLU42171.1 hypothetical protein BO222_02010 [Ileibacterium valens]OLU42665.1 hypothetical protein BO224_01590 [Erysipelotrichaceae bacterium NYU-BL-E8]
MSQPIYVIGHKRPDSDSICAAISLANLKRELGENAVAARLGHLNPETQFILNKVGVKPPILLTTAKNSLEEIEIDEAILINRMETLRYGWDLLLDNDAKTIYVVDDEGNFSGIVTLAEISKIQMQDLNKTKELLKDTPTMNLRDVVHGKILYEGNRKKSGEVRISDKKMMDRDLTGAIMVLNDHEDNMIKAMAKGAAVIIIAEDFVPNDYIFEMAKSMGVTLISTPYNLMKIIQMIYRSIPVEFIMTPKEDAIMFHPSEYTEDVEREMLKTRHSSYPVVEGKRIVGSVARYNLLKAEKKKFILVDHNESKQSIDDRDKGEVLEIVDHHRIGDIETDKPIVYRNMIVGSSCTIVAMMYNEYGITMPDKIARLILYAMISDTMNFNSPTCTQTDKLVAAKIEMDYGLDTDKMAEELFKATATIEGKEFKNILYNDCKEFTFQDLKANISQVFLFDYKEVDKIEPEFTAYMESEIAKTKLDLWIMAFTNVEGKGSRFIAVGPLAERLKDAIVQFEEKGFVSRKKQIVPGVAAALR